MHKLGNYFRAGLCQLRQLTATHINSLEPRDAQDICLIANLPFGAAQRVFHQQIPVVILGARLLGVLEGFLQQRALLGLRQTHYARKVREAAERRQELAYDLLLVVWKRERERECATYR